MFFSLSYISILKDLSGFFRNFLFNKIGLNYIKFCRSLRENLDRNKAKIRYAIIVFLIILKFNVKQVYCSMDNQNHQLFFLFFIVNNKILLIKCFFTVFSYFGIFSVCYILIIDENSGSLILKVLLSLAPTTNLRIMMLFE